jgi:hypothetical protein
MASPAATLASPASTKADFSAPVDSASQQIDAPDTLRGRRIAIATAGSERGDNGSSRKLPPLIIQTAHLQSATATQPSPLRYSPNSLNGPSITLSLPGSASSSASVSPRGDSSSERLPEASPSAVSATLQTPTGAHSVRLVSPGELLEVSSAQGLSADASRSRRSSASIGAGDLPRKVQHKDGRAAFNTLLDQVFNGSDETVRRLSATVDADTAHIPYLRPSPSTGTSGWVYLIITIVVIAVVAGVYFAAKHYNFI